jgi:hypothetical protein
MATKCLTARQEQEMRQALRDLLVRPLRETHEELREGRIESQLRRWNDELRSEIRALRERVAALERPQP